MASSPSDRRWFVIDSYTGGRRGRRVRRGSAELRGGVEFIERVVTQPGEWKASAPIVKIDVRSRESISGRSATGSSVPHGPEIMHLIRT